MIPSPIVRVAAVPLTAALRLFALIVVAVALTALLIVHVLTAVARLIDPALRQPRKKGAHRW